MSSQVQFRRGTTTQNNAFTGAVGELSIDTDIKTIRIHDGTTPGGTVVATIGATQTLTNKTLSTGSIWNGTAVGLGYGGTGGQLTPVAGAIAYSTAGNIQLSAAGTSGQVLTSSGTGAPVWVSQSTLTVGTATSATNTTNITGGSAGQLVIQTDTSTTGFITAGAAGTFLKSAGAGYAPQWATGQVTFGTTTVALGDTSANIGGLSNVAITGTTNSTSTTSGALTVAGGVGVAQDAYFGGNVYTTHVIPQANVTYSLGSPTCWYKDLYLSGGTIYIGGATISTSGGNLTITNPGGGSLTVSGTAGGQSTGTFGNLAANSGVASTSTTTGALTVTGGAGITGDIYIGGNLNVAGTTNTINNTVIETTEYVVTVDATTVRSATLGNIGANVVGTGTYLTSLNATNLSSGTVNTGRISGSYTGITAVGTLTGLTATGNVDIQNTLYARGVYDNSTRVVSTSSGAGNLTISGTGINLTATGPGAGTVGSSTQLASITTDAYGRVVAGSQSALNASAVTLLANTSEIVSNSAVGTAGLNLTTTGVSAGTYGSATAVPVITVDTKGRISSVTTAAPSTTFTLTGTTGSVTVGAASSLSMVGTYGVTVSVGNEYANIATPQDIRTSASPTFVGLTLSGNLASSSTIYGNGVYDNGVRVVSTSTGAGNLSISGTAIALPATGPGAGSVGSSTAIPVITTDAYGRVSATTTAAVIAPAGTLSGSTLNSGVTASSLTSVGTLTGLTVSGNTIVNNTVYAQGVYDNSNRVVSTSTGAGNLTISGTGISLTATGPGATTVGSSSAIPVVTVDAYGRVTALTSSSISTSFTITGTSGSATIAGGSSLKLAGTYGVTVAVGSEYANIATPQDLQTTASPTFSAGTFNGTVVASAINAGTIGNASAVLYGTLNSSSASQPNVTTLAGLTSFGASGVTTTSVGPLSITDSTASSSTSTGALKVSGGAGISGAIYAGSIQNTPIGSTTASTGAFTSLTAQTETVGGLQAKAIGNVTPGSAQFTTVGTSGIVTINDSTQNTGSGTGALQVAGGASVGGNLYVGGNINLSGTTNIINSPTGIFTGNTAGFGALYAGITGSYSFQSQTVLQISSNFNGYAQVNNQNINAGTGASTDYVATMDTGTATSGYIDMGINSSAFNGATAGQTASYAGDGYLYVQANATGSIGNLLIGTTGSTGNIFFVTGGQNTNNQVMTITSANTVVVTNTQSATSTTSGAFQVTGGAGIAGALYAGSVYDNGTRVVSTSTGTGNLTISGTGISLTATGPGATTVGSSTSIPVITTDAYGRVTALTSSSVSTTISLSGNTGSGSVSGGGTLTVGGTRGVTVATSGSTFTINTPQDLQTSASPTFAALTVNTGNLTLNGSSTPRILGNFNDISTNNRMMFQNYTGSAGTFVGIVPSADNNDSGYVVYAKATSQNSAYIQMGMFNSGGEARIATSYTGVAMYVPMTFYTSNSERVRIGVNGGVAIGNTTDPGAGNLTVAGSANIVGTLSTTGTLYTPTINASSVNAATIGNASAVLYGTLNSSSATQNNITTMAGLTSFGTAGVTTTAAGNFTVTGNLTINGTTNTINNTVIETTEYVSTIDATTVRASTIGNTGATLTGTTVSLGSAAITSVSSTTSATVETIVDSFALATYRSAKYEAQMTAGSYYQVIELRVLHDGINVNLAQYGEMNTNGNLGIFNANISGSNVNLLFTPVNATTTVKLLRNTIVV